jgi:hypothetical protein
MLYRSSTGAFALAAALMMTIGGAQAANDVKYLRTRSTRVWGPGSKVQSDQGLWTGAASAADSGVSEGQR